MCPQGRDDECKFLNRVMRLGDGLERVWRMGRDGKKLVIVWILSLGDKKNYGSKPREKHRSQERELVEKREPSEFIYVVFEKHIHLFIWLRRC